MYCYCKNMADIQIRKQTAKRKTSDRFEPLKQTFCCKIFLVSTDLESSRYHKIIIRKPLVCKSSKYKERLTLYFNTELLKVILFSQLDLWRGFVYFLACWFNIGLFYQTIVSNFILRFGVEQCCVLKIRAVLRKRLAKCLVDQFIEDF